MSGVLHIPGECKRDDISAPTPATALVTVAGSAGAYAIVRHLLSCAPPALQAAIIVMLHTTSRSRLSSTLSLASQRPVGDPVSGELLRNGCVYVAAPKTHLVVNPDACLAVSQASPVRGFRPSADWLFESAAAAFRERHVAVVLSGLLSDGAARLAAVKRHGGTVLVQSPADAEFPSMPAAAIATGCADEILPTAALADAIWRCVARCADAADADSWDGSLAPTDASAASA